MGRKVEKTVPYGLGLYGHTVKKYVKFKFQAVSHTLYNFRKKIAELGGPVSKI